MTKLKPHQALKKLRDKRGWTQEELARNIGVSVFSVNRWERGAFKPSQLAWAQLAKLFEEEGLDVEKPIRKRT